MKAIHKYVYNLSLVLIGLFTLSAAYAPNDPVDGEFIQEWLVLGPFFPNDLERDFLMDAGGEVNVAPKENDTVVTANGDTLAWKRHQIHQGVLDLFDVVENFEHGTAYAFCNLKSDVRGKHRILLGSEDGVAVRINGQRVHYHPASRYFFLDHDEFGVNLRRSHAGGNAPGRFYPFSIRG